MVRFHFPTVTVSKECAGYSKIYLVGQQGDLTGPLHDRLYYTKPGRLNTPLEAPSSDISYELWSILPKCDLIIITVNSDDTSACVDKLSATLVNCQVAVVSLQRGVKNSSIVKDGWVYLMTV